MNPGWTVRIIDLVPGSTTHWSKFIPHELLPKAFVEGTMDGPFVGQHSADFLRGALLYLYGGVYLDISVILFRTLDRICWNRLQDPSDSYEVAACWVMEDVVQNSFIAARKGNLFIKRWHELLVHVWDTPIGRTNCIGVTENPLLRFTKDLGFPAPGTDDLLISLSALQDYLAQIVCWRRMCRLSAPDKDIGGLDFHEYWKTNVMPINMLKEGWALEELCGFSGERPFELLTAKLDDADNSEHFESQNLIWRLLTRSSFQKIPTGKHVTRYRPLGFFLSSPGNIDKDCEPGTYAELLRYGAEHFIQLRDEIVLAQLPELEVKLQRGVLDE
jgi:hypothetical protein